MERTTLLVEELTKLNEEDKKKYSLFIWENGNPKKEYEYRESDDIHELMRILKARREALGDDGYIFDNEIEEKIEDQALDNEYMFLNNTGVNFKFIITPKKSIDKSVFNKLTHHMDFLVDVLDYDLTFEDVKVEDKGDTVEVTGKVYGKDIADLETATLDTELYDTWPEIENLEVVIENNVDDSVNLKEDIDPKTNDVDDLYAVWIPYVGKRIVNKEKMIRILEKQINKVKESTIWDLGEGLAFRCIQIMDNNNEPLVPTRSDDDFLKNLDWKD